jgi:hypothetical protein
MQFGMPVAMVLLNILLSFSCSAAQINIEAANKKTQKIIQIYQENQNQLKLESLKEISKSSIRNKKLTAKENKKVEAEIQKVEKILDSMDRVLQEK